MEKILSITQLVSSILLIIVVLLQNREGGTTGILGGEGVGGSFYTKRGLEKGLLYATIVFSAVFFFSSVFRFVIK